MDTMEMGMSQFALAFPAGALSGRASCWKQWIGQRVRLARQQASTDERVEISQEMLARRLKMHPRRLWEIENGLLAIDAVEIEGDGSYIAGNGPPGANMRLYVDGVPAGVSPVEGGRWLVEGNNLLTQERQTLQVEALDPATGKQIGEATIVFERPVPEPQAGQVLLQVRAAGINRPDIMQRQGSAKPAPGATDVLGLEACGKIVACGPGV